MPPVSDAGFDPSKILEDCRFTDCPELNRPMILPDMFAAEAALREIVREFREKKRYCADMASAIFKQVLVKAIRAALAGSSQRSDTVEQVIAYIRENYDRPISNKEIAEQVNYHEFYVNKLMIKQTGMTLHRYLSGVRVQNAAKLLENTDMPLTAIAERCGFASASHFSGVFSRFMGKTPARWRKDSGRL